MTPDPDDDLTLPGDPVPADPERLPRRSLLRRTLALAVVAVGAVLVGVVVADLVVGDAGTSSVTMDGSGTTADAPPRLDAGQRSGTEDRPLPEMTLDGFDGEPPVELAAYRGSPLLVNFWATWCAPCVEEMPAIQEVAEGLEGRVAVLGVNVQDAPANAEPFVQELDVGYDLAVDADGRLYAEVRAFGMPTTLLVDADGTIVYRHTGPLDAPELRALVGEHLGVPAGAGEPSASP